MRVRRGRGGLEKVWVGERERERIVPAGTGREEGEVKEVVEGGRGAPPRK
jgi:hypothetical protein